MKKEILIPVVIIATVAVLALGYLGRHKIKALLGMSTPISTTINQTNSQSSSNNIYLTKTSSTKGNYMTDFAGNTLYTFDKDTSGVSNCTGECLVAWPAYTSGAVNEGNFPTGISVITRPDGSKQFAWQGMPLYYFQSDKSAGNINGDGVNGFHIVKL